MSCIGRSRGHGHLGFPGPTGACTPRYRSSKSVAPGWAQEAGLAGAGRVSLSFWAYLRAALWQELMISMINGSLNESLAHEAESVRLALRGREGGETEVGVGGSQQPSRQAHFLLLGSFLPSHQHLLNSYCVQGPALAQRSQGWSSMVPAPQ